MASVQILMQRHFHIGYYIFSWDVWQIQIVGLEIISGPNYSCQRQPYQAIEALAGFTQDGPPISSVKIPFCLSNELGEERDDVENELDRDLP
ncbi:histone-lysine N-methyltransferase setd3-like isoform X1 [Gossypium australe]|uniref:Histone-lysine N-methyltransferase setd3-like isoform X1 n=1 Tax=Gossypium australe TaxID=47621 RepID=A0A5B6W2T2_9ROSI|nr:histone-lysine N-methyltransferase setd3-like isoform X1 [Gossypium australe]